MVVQGVHTFTHNRVTLTQVYPYNRIIHPKGDEGSLKDIQKK